ncbi:beta-glucuronidase-like [Tigriopus californicus]|uniref:beta-glucuronidase-like n=1 Tax=Tigriopus californicus TaxID=6832 RepID=UPI0027DA4931|nr:beta-glucuronidase-like [Tigriopus californicus]
MKHLLVVSALLLSCCHGLLYPKDSPTREIKSLDGVWNFRAQPSLDPEQGFREKWFDHPLQSTGDVIDMPVPSSFNDITTDPSLRDFAGWVWYDREFYAPSAWSDSRVFLRFGSAHYTALVWLNGQEVLQHSGGHLPFETDVSGTLQLGAANRLTVALNNTLGPTTIPQGAWNWIKEDDIYPAGSFDMSYTFDFFNYAGIHRPVTLYTVPKSLHVADVKVTTIGVAQDYSSATIQYEVNVATDTDDFQCHVQLLEQDGTVAAEQDGCTGTITLAENPHLWWPYLMNEEYGYLYTFRVDATNSQESDQYNENIGIRSVFWDDNSFKINHQPFYFRGFGRHEDSNFRGKGLDLPLVTKDYNLIRWTGANSYRTSHYPYAEELMDFADRNGIVIIDECPGVNLEGFKPELLANHLTVMDELVARDKNHPSVVMWSIGNEPRSEVPEAKDYFIKVANHTRSIDPSRPVTLVMFRPFDQDQGGYSVDIVSINRYYGWYSQTGQIDLIANAVEQDIRNWRTKFNKPVLVTEYGADTIHGFHEVPSTIFTEEYQTDLMRENFKAFDNTKEDGILIGEMIWNFADFMTVQEYKRVWGNRKGIFTRDRHPKASAHILRDRYWKLAQDEGLPRNLEEAFKPRYLYNQCPAAAQPAVPRLEVIYKDKV